jgi:selenide,water dikinase
MGGTPLTVLNLMCFPRKKLDLAVMTEILRGGLEKIHEAEAVLLGGHTVDDDELKYGLSVTGTVHPRRILTNKGARPGDVLILTKKIGTGVVATAAKAEMAEPAALETAVESMARLNKDAARAMAALDVHGCTDITGFGLVGHAAEMANGAGLSFHLYYSQIPVLPRAREYAALGLIPAGAYCNRDHFGRATSFASQVPDAERILLFDPQTSGGLLIALSPSEGEKLLRALRDGGIQEAALIGAVAPRGEKAIAVEL